LKRILELAGYKVILQDHYNWILAKDDFDFPVVLPRLGDHVPVEILMDTVFAKAGMNLHTFMAFRKAAEVEFQGPVN